MLSISKFIIDQTKKIFSDKIYHSRTLDKAIKDNPNISLQLSCFLKIYPEFGKISNLIICICKDKNLPKCLNCNKLIKYVTIRAHKNARFCCPECSFSSIGKEERSKKEAKTMLARYGVKNRWEIEGFREKIENTLMKNYGVKSPGASSEIQLRVKQSLFLNYGVENPLQSKEIQLKSQKTLLEKYGVDNISKNKDIILKRKETIKNINYKNLSKKLFKKRLCFIETAEEYFGVENRKYNFKCLDCGHIFNGSINNGAVPKCICKKPKMLGISKGEKEVVDFIKSIYNNEIIENSRNIIKPYELDVYLPELKLAFEYNGVYWHKKREETTPGYHSIKSKLCKDLGIKLIHIWDTEWLTNKQNKVKNKLLKLIK